MPDPMLPRPAPVMTTVLSLAESSGLLGSMAAYVVPWMILVKAGALIMVFAMVVCWLYE